MRFLFLRVNSAASSEVGHFSCLPKLLFSSITVKESLQGVLPLKLKSFKLRQSNFLALPSAHRIFSQPALILHPCLPKLFGCSALLCRRQSKIFFFVCKFIISFLLYLELLISAFSKLTSSFHVSFISWKTFWDLTARSLSTSSICLALTDRELWFGFHIHSYTWNYRVNRVFISPDKALEISQKRLGKIHFSKSLVFWLISWMPFSIFCFGGFIGWGFLGTFKSFQRL